jgi:hypothetical protein
LFRFCSSRGLDNACRYLLGGDFMFRNRFLLLLSATTLLSGCYVEISSEDYGAHSYSSPLAIQSGNSAQVATAVVPINQLALVPAAMAINSDHFTNLSYPPPSVNRPLFDLANNLSSAFLNEQYVDLDDCLLNPALEMELQGITDTSPDYQYGDLILKLGSDYCDFQNYGVSGHIAGETTIDSEWFSYLPTNEILNLDVDSEVRWQITQHYHMETWVEGRLSINGNDIDGYNLNYRVQLELENDNYYGDITAYTVSDIRFSKHDQRPMSGHVRIEANYGRLDLFMYQDGVVIQLNDYLEHYLSWPELESMSQNMSGW